MKEYKDELCKLFTQLIVTIGSLIASYFLPISNHFFKISSKEVLQGIDIAIYSLIISAIIIGISYFWLHLVMKVEISIKEDLQESSNLYFVEDDVDRNDSNGKVKAIRLCIEVSGKKRKNSNILKLTCPDSYLLDLVKSTEHKQDKSYKFIKEVKASEVYEIDLNEMLEKNLDKRVSATRNIDFMLLLEEYHKGNKDEIGVHVERNILGKLIRIKIQPLIIIQK